MGWTVLSAIALLRGPEVEKSPPISSSAAVAREGQRFSNCGLCQASRVSHRRLSDEKLLNRKEQEMVKDVLVAYASKYGATQEIAEKIGDVLSQAGLQVDVFPVDSIRDLHPYKAVILGSAVYVGKWQKEAVEFLRTNEIILTARSVWLFSSGPTGHGDPVELVEGQRLPDSLQPLVDRIRPRDIAVFHGHINPAKINLIEKWAIKSLVKKPFGDFRDWDAISSWATSIADALNHAERASLPS
jgi:menaquinone-dependent protoporphyrinogen oxidase